MTKHLVTTVPLLVVIVSIVMRSFLAEGLANCEGAIVSGGYFWSVPPLQGRYRAEESTKLKSDS